MTATPITPLNGDIRSTLIEVRKELLDFGMRNPLLNYRLLKSRGLEIFGVPPREVYEALVTEGRELPFWFLDDVQRELLPQRIDAIDTSLTSQALARRKPGYANGNSQRLTGLGTRLQETELEKRLLATYYTAKSSIEEQGVNTLFIALGMLHWSEPGDKDEVRHAPLLLIPVELDRRGAGEGFRLKYSGEDVIPNVCLLEYLKQAFGLKANNQEDSEELAVDDYFQSIGRLVSKQDGWSVDPETIALGFFSFAKFLMYRDLDPATWDDEDALLKHGLLNRLLGSENFGAESSTYTESDFLDDHLLKETGSHVLDADSTQSLAILDVAAGRNMVIQGPPGTGKSQTIVNLIAQAMASGKKVLFVAEKKAALEVVKQRLDNIKLGLSCLELHSNKVRKKDVIEDLKRTASAQNGQPLRETEDQALLTDAMKSLNDYCNAANEKIGASQETVRDLFGLLLPIAERFAGHAIPALKLEGCCSWSGIDLHRKRGLVSRLQERLIGCGVPSKHPFWGSELQIVLPSTRESLRAILREAAGRAGSVAFTAGKLAQALSQADPGSIEDLDTLCATTKQITNAPNLLGLDLADSRWLKEEDGLRFTIAAGRRYDEIRYEWSERITSSAWSEDVSHLKAEAEELSTKWWRALSPRWRELRRTVTGFTESKNVKPSIQITSVLDAIHTASQCKAQVDECTKLLGELFRLGPNSTLRNWQQVEIQLNWITDTLRGIDCGKYFAWSLTAVLGTVDRKSLEALEADAAQTAKEYDAVARQVMDALRIGSAQKSVIHALAQRGWTSSSEASWSSLIGRVDEIDGLVAYIQVRAEYLTEGLPDVVELADNWEQAQNQLRDAFEYRRISAMLDSAFQNRPVLARFDRTHHSRIVETFRHLDAGTMTQARLALAHSHVLSLPKPTTSNGQLGVLWREFEKKARHLPVRQLITKAGNAIQAIKPVFMMSPLSVANFLPTGAVQFDLVIFDEASQVKPADALGALVRGTQAVVVGDSKQLPPTSFFDAMVAQDADTEEEESVATSDIESVLGLFCSRGAHQRMLRWHYRSKHESLIAGSNHLFYDDRLVVFPSPDRGKEVVGLVYRRVANAHYDRAKTRTNPGEARAVAEAVMRHATEQLRKPAEERLTLGVATLSVAQRDAILNQLEILRRKSPGCEEFFSTPQNEPFFAKNLENVQGDERDVIFISIGYGRTTEGYLAMSFGPVNRAGGERRLNVLFSRARKRCEVFTTLCADDIDANGNSAGGVYALKTFLRYAESGFFDVPRQTGRPPESPFEEQVLAALQKQGYTVHTQVGSGGFSIDMAVVDPSNPGRYLLGIECDGAAYHSARSTRDRDRLRQSVLVSLGWSIHRIWSTAWFRSPEKEFGFLQQAIEEAKSGTAVPATTPISQPETEFETSSTQIDPVLPTTVSPTTKYVLAQLHITSGTQELHLVSVTSLSEWLSRVVAVESPVHWLDATRRIANALGVQKIGSRIQEAFKRACSHGVQFKKFRLQEEFLWELNTSAPTVRDRSDFPAQLKKLEFVAAEEVMAAIKQVVSESLGMFEPDVAPAACRLLGFARVSVDMRETVESLCDALVNESQLLRRGEMLVVSKASA
jgi:very-short-patch-repair endonuclease